MKYDAVIVGAGMSGLAAGIRLAQYDKKVCILERHSVLGGLNSFYKKDGRLFDVGLHAMTNFAKKGTKKGPLPTIARQLRLDLDRFGLLEQKHSLIRFPSALLRFTNQIEDFTSEISERFPDESDGFIKLCRAVTDHDDGSIEQVPKSARSVLAQHLRSRLLTEMILCPLLFYGSATEHDMDWNQFVIMFKAIYFEGFSRPHDGVRTVIQLLRKTYLERGGELKMGTGVNRLEPIAAGGVLIHLENGESMEAARVLSSAGYFETLQLLGERPDRPEEAGHMSFVETIFCLDCAPRELDIHSSILFYSQRDDFQYKKPGSLVDFDSGIFCSPNNFEDESPHKENVVRMTNIANYDLWKSFRTESEDRYCQAKNEYIRGQLESLSGIVPTFKEHITYTDSFTPCTIEHFTSHLQGAVYGSQTKNLSGDIGQKDVFICGTDQGYLGIVGAMLSGIIMANRHVLQ